MSGAFKSLTGDEMKYYKQKFSELPPTTNKYEKLKVALSSKIPIEYLIDSEILLVEDMLKLDIDEETFKYIAGYFEYKGMLQNQTVEEYLEIKHKRELEQLKNQYDNKLSQEEPLSKREERLKNEIDGLKEEVEQLKHKLNGTEAKLRDKDKDIELHKEKVKILSSQLDKLREENRNILSKYANVDLKYKQYEDEIKSLEGLVKDKVDEIKGKEEEIQKLNNNIQEIETKHKDNVNSLIDVYESKIGEYKEMLKNSSTSIDVVGEVSSNDLMVKRARLEGKKIIGVTGNTRKFIMSKIKEIENCVILEEPSEADLWIYVITFSKQSIEKFKQNIQGKDNVIVVLNLWNRDFIFKPEVSLGHKVDLVIEYSTYNLINTWTGNEEKWEVELNNLIRQVI